MDKGTFDYNGNSITIHGYDRPFTAYIMRKECAEYVISKNKNSTFSVDAILEQLKKNVRILEQLEETDTRTLQCVDEVNPITDKDNRIGKVLSFDEYGDPVCKVEVEDVENIKTYRDEASASATKASGHADSASASADSALTTKGEIETLVGGFNTTVENAQKTVLEAIDFHYSDIILELDKYADATEESLEDIKKQSQELLDNAVEITDPDRFMRDIQMFKANSGALHFNGGNAQCSGLANKPIPNINTIAFRWKCDAITFENIPVGKRVIGYVGSWYHLARISGYLQFYVKYVDGPQYINLTESNIITLLTDGNWHNVAIISTGTTFDFAIDGKILKSVARSKTTGFAIPTSNFIVSYSTTNIGSIADVFIFNFDITSADAPYTLADYQQGKPIPPKALNGFTAPMESFTREAGRTASATYTNGVIDYTGSTTETSVITSVRTPFIAKAGDKIRIVNTPATLGGSAVVFNLFFRDDSNNEAISAGIGTTSQAVSLLNANDVIIELTRDITKLAFICEPQSKGSIQDVSASCNIQVEKVGTILALEDYAIENGNSKIVFDYSGNNNDATITGDVKGDNDNRVAKLVEFIKSQQG